MRSLVWLICTLFLLSSCSTTAQPSASQDQTSNQAAAQVVPTRPWPRIAPTAKYKPTPKPKPTAEPTAEPSAEPTSAPAVSEEDISAIIRNAMQASTKAGPFHSVLIMEEDGITSRIESFVILPSKIHVIVEEYGITSEAIVIDDRMWTKSESGWKESQGANAIAPMIERTVKDLEAGGLTLNNFQYLGSEELNGILADLYSYDAPFPSSQPYSWAAKIWIAKESGLPIKQEFIPSPNGAKQTQTITYDPNITIEPPI